MKLVISPECAQWFKRLAKPNYSGGFWERKKERERKNNVCHIYFFLFLLSRLTGTLGGTKQSKSSPPPPYLSPRRYNRNPITFVLVTQILINAVYKRDPDRSALSARGEGGRRGPPSPGMRADGRRVQYLFGGVARQEQPDTAAQAQCCFCSTSLISQMSLAEAGPCAPAFFQTNL